MPISHLSQSTVQALSSSQVLVDSVSLAKELVENALDAGATSISVELSSNALDVVQVKDNGHGVTPNDRELLVRQHCTSKIRNLEDLSNIGGKYLGFRGVALASAAEMSGSLIIQTRTESELLGEVLKFDRQGKIISCAPKSLPSGTTVRVENFLKFIPVRRQASLKDSPKLLKRMNSLLHSYALARPSVRFSIKVIGDENNRVNWMYGAKKDATITDAAIKIFGSSLASNCALQYWTPSLGFVKDVSQVYQDNTSYGIAALLPAQECDVSCISSSGQFFSVDSRPVSCKRGSMRRVNDIFKNYVQKISKATPKLISPFICLNLICPRGSYDPNIEPAKDDVLFNEEDKILDICEDFFQAVYGEQEGDCEGEENIEGGNITSKLLPRNRTAGINDGVSSRRVHQCLEASPLPTSAKHGNLVSPKLSEHNPPSDHLNRLLSSPLCSPQKEIRTPKTSFPAINRPVHGWQPSMYQVPKEMSEDCSELILENGISGDEEPDQSAKSASNPWTIAKMNAPLRKKPLQPERSETMEFNGQLLTPPRVGDVSSPVRIVSSRPILAPRHVNQLLSPEKDVASPLHATTFSSPPQASGYQRSAHFARAATIQPRLPRLKAQRQEQQASTKTYGNKERKTTLDTWMSGPRQMSKPPSEPPSSGGLSLNDIPDVSQRPRQAPSHSRRQQQQSLMKPFVSPIPKSSLQGVRPRSSNPLHLALPPRRPPMRRPNTSLNSEETIKNITQSPNRPQRAPLPLPQPSPAVLPRAFQHPRKSPQNNLWLSQEPSLSTDSARPTPSLLTFRSPSRSPSSEEAHHSIKVPTLTLITSISAISRVANKAAAHDLYVQGRNQPGTFGAVYPTPSANIIGVWERQVRYLLAKMGGNGMLDGELDLGRKLREHARGT